LTIASTPPILFAMRSLLAVDDDDTTMVSVGAATNVNEFNGQVGSFPNPTGFTPKSPNKVLIAAPGENWRIRSAQAYPAAGLSSGVVDCTLPPYVMPGQVGNAITRCTGTSFAAPVVAGAAVLVLANNPAFSPAGIKARLLDAAAAQTSLENIVQGSRFLDIAAAVGP